MATIKITTHSGGEYTAEMEPYEAAALNEQLNDDTVNTVLFGDIILSRIDVKSVVPEQTA